MAEMACVARGRARRSHAGHRESGAKAGSRMYADVSRGVAISLPSGDPFVGYQLPDAQWKGNCVVRRDEWVRWQFLGQLKAKADPQRRCGKGNTPRERLNELRTRMRLTR